MTELTLPFRGLLARPLRTFLTVLGIALAVAGFVALTGLTAGVQRSFASGMDETGADLIVGQRSAFNLVSSTVPIALGPALASVPNVDAVSGVLLTITTADEDANIVMAGWPSDSFLWKDVPLVAGRLPLPADEWPVVLGASIAATLDKHVGDTVELQFQPYKIVGIAAFSSLLNQNSAIVTLQGLQQILSQTDAFTLYEVRLKPQLDSGDIAEAKARLTEAARGFDVSDTDQFANNIRVFNLLKAIAQTISLVVMAMGSAMIANTLLMAVNERTFEIGVLAAIGWSPQRILRLIVIEGVIMCAAGGIAGICLGVIAMEVAARTKFAAGLIVPYLSTWSLAQALIFVFIAGPLGALYPAWRATRLLPAEALRRL